MTSHARTRRLLDWKAVLGLVVSAVFLYLALRGVSLRLVAREIASANPWLFLGAIACATLVFWIRAWRWRSIIRPIYPATQFRNRNVAANRDVADKVDTCALGYFVVTLADCLQGLVIGRNSETDEAIRHWIAVEDVDARFVTVGLFQRLSGIETRRTRTDHCEMPHAPLPLLPIA